MDSLFTTVLGSEPSRSFLIGTSNFLPDKVLGTSLIFMILSGTNLADMEFFIAPLIFSFKLSDNAISGYKTTNSSHITFSI